ncbi:glucosamine-6-phosphate isomerase [Holotrichia oblita]|nr:glucosamine-6-phosphate isomerase [Holotrichia oblita]
MIAKQINEKPASVLGLATGSTPLGTYGKLVEMNKAGAVDFSHVVSFNLDEYCGLSRDNPQSYHYFMMKNLFSHINIDKRNINIPNGAAKNFDKECKRYEKLIADAGGIDLQLLGIGRNGHIGFNEPDTVFHNKTRKVELTADTIDANKRFFEREADVPRQALTMGIGTIMAARKIMLLAGPDKREIIDKLKTEVVSPQLPASILHYHPDCTIIFAKGK